MALSPLQQEARIVRRAAENALAGMLIAAGVELDGERRCEQPELNLVPAVIERWGAIAPQLGGGNGGELYESASHRPKFCSAFSSCALAVNTFGRFDDPATLPLPGGETFAGGVRFEAQRLRRRARLQAQPRLGRRTRRRRLAVRGEQVH